MFSDANLFEFRGPFGFRIEMRQSVLFLVLVWVLFGFNLAQLPYLAMTLAILIVSIVLHEIGHAWALKVQGIPVRNVVIYGGGGYTTPGRSLGRREDEFVTAMGPIVNLTIWAIASLIWPMLGGGLFGWLLWTTAAINLFLAIFNLMPVLPLDGGRLFALLMHRFFKPRLATRIAGFVGVAMSLLWALYLINALLGGGGFLLLFVPNFQRHWQMLRTGA